MRSENAGVSHERILRILLRGCVLLFLALGLSGVAALGADAVATAPATDMARLLDPPTGVFADQWYAVMLSGRKCGQMRTRQERISSPDGDLIRTWTKMQMTVLRGQARLSVGISQKNVETLEGRPKSFSREQHLGQQPVISEGTIEDGKVRIKASQYDNDGGDVPVSTYDLPENAMMDWAVFREQVKHGWAPGTRYELPIYEPSLSPDKVCPTTVEVLGTEMLDLFGRKVKATKTRQTMKIPQFLGRTGTQETTTWFNESGEIVRVTMSVMDIPIEIQACAKSVAMAEDDPAELMVSMLIPLNQPLDGHKARKVTYRIALKESVDSSVLPELPETATQKVVARQERQLTLEVTRPSAREAKPARVELTEDERERYLAATTMVNHLDPQIAQLAKEAAGDETDPRKVGELLCRFVGRHVESKTLNVGFATASEVARSREGDCTEHGLLLAAMGRARGIPTRVITGLVHSDSFGGRRNVLVGHMWTQFWIDGEWVDLDAALHQTDIDPTHIALSISTAGDASMADLVTSTWLSLSQLTIAVEQAE